MKKIWIVILLFVLFSCRKEHPRSSGLPPADGSPVTVSLNQDRPGRTIPKTFEGLSFETQILTANPEFLNVNNTVLIQLIKNLGPGILRIGGGTSDEVFWSENIRSANTTADSLTKTDIDRLSDFSKAIGWQVLFGLNLGDNDVIATSNEAMYVHNSLAGNLYALQSGNEPDVFHYGMRSSDYKYPDYQNEWETYLSAVRNKVPQAEFAGPDVAYNSDWVTSFGENENNNVKLLDGHYYTTGPATNSSITYHTILASNDKLSNFLGVIKNESVKYNLPYRITETNNVYGGGKSGVSDVFASSLWALDVMWTVAENNGDGINFHGGYGLFYSPVLIQNDLLTASPEYYAMLAFKYASAGGTIIPASVDNPGYCSAYACVKAGNIYSFTLINKDEIHTYSFALNLNKAASIIQIARLTAPSLTAATGTTFAGSLVNADGTFEAKTIEQYAVNGKSFVINVPAGSAAVVTVQ
ncbi:MAG TPA: glycosyl hydrolase family protein [Mucilaginibacter sp.]